MWQKRVVGWVARFLCVGLCWLLAGSEPGLAKKRKTHKTPKPPAAQRSSSELLSEQGLRALAEKEYARAYAALSESYRLVPSAEGLFYLARLAAAEQRVLEAHDLYKRYLLDPARKTNPTFDEQAKEALFAAVPTCGQVAVLSEPGAVVSVDERLVGSLPLPSPVLLVPGEHRLAVDYPARRLEGMLTIAPGRRYEMRFDPKSKTLVVSLLSAVLAVNDWSGLVPEHREAFNQALDQTLRSVDQTVLAAEDALVAAPHLRECITKANCQQLLAQKADVEFVLHASVRHVEKGDGLQLKTIVRHREVSEPAAQKTVACPKCSPEQLLPLFQQTALAVLTEALSRRTAVLSVTTTPAAAVVLLKKNRLGLTPLRRTLWADSHELTITAQGHKPVETKVTLVPGEPTSLDMTLEPVVKTVLRADTKGQPRRAWLWVGLGAAAVVTAVTVGLTLGLTPQTHDKVGWLP